MHTLVVVTLFSYIGITHTGAIIGGVVGGLLALVFILVAGILIAALLGFLVHRKKTLSGMCTVPLCFMYAFMCIHVKYCIC